MGGDSSVGRELAAEAWLSSARPGQSREDGASLGVLRGVDGRGEADSGLAVRSAARSDGRLLRADSAGRGNGESVRRSM